MVIPIPVSLSLSLHKKNKTKSNALHQLEKVATLRRAILGEVGAVHAGPCAAELLAVLPEHASDGVRPQLPGHVDVPRTGGLAKGSHHVLPSNLVHTVTKK